MQGILITVTLCVTMVVQVYAAGAPCDPPVDGCTCQGTDTILMQCNNIDSLPEPLNEKVDKFMCDGCTSLGTKLAKLPAAYSSVKYLFLHNCAISEIEDGAFSELPKLQHLSLSSNKLTTLSKAALSGLSNCTWLELDSNLLTSLPNDVFSSVKGMEKLDLSHNDNLDLSADVLDGLPITELRLTGIGLDKFPKDLLDNVKTSLDQLHLAHNDIKVIKKNTFKDFMSLSFLTLDSCGIEKIENGAFDGLENVKHINLGYNKLTSVDADVFKPLHDSLEELLLEHNQLTTLEEDIVDWKKIKELSIGGNPWHCDCDLKWMYTLDVDNLDTFLHENVTCKTPADFEGKKLSNVTAEMSCGCKDCGGKSTVALGIAIPILIICVALIGYYLYRIMQSRKNRAIKRKGYNYSSVYKDTVEPSRQAGPV